jgi:sugar phosphate isomerase/epimerase
MKKNISRRNFLQKTAVVSGTAVMLPGYALSAEKNKKGNEITFNKNPLKLGLMTYTLAKDWNIDTIIKNCTETKFEHIELRTTHAHGVEVKLSAEERAIVKKRFQDAGLAISLASGFQYHYPDQNELKKNIEGTKEYVLLAKDVGARGVRVFAGSISKIPDEKILTQIARSLADVGEFGYNNGVEIRVCNDGPTIAMIKKLIDMSQSPHVYVNWNCPASDLEGAGFEPNFNSVKNIIRNIHIRELWNDYPWRQFFSLLSQSGYKGYCDAEVNASADPIRFMKYYRALFLAYQDAV